jgi:hypothetical protein
MTASSPILLEFPVQGCGADAQSSCRFGPIAARRTQRRDNVVAF